MITKSYFFLMVFAAFFAAPMIISLVVPEEEVVLLSVIEEENTNDTSMEFEKNIEVYLHSYSFSGFQTAVLNSSDFDFKELLLDRYAEPYCPPPQLI